MIIVHYILNVIIIQISDYQNINILCNLKAFNIKFINGKI